MFYSSLLKFFSKPGNSKYINLEESQWFDYDKLIDFQEQRLRFIIKYAYESIPGYKKKMKAFSLSPRNIRCLDDLKKLPITTREELQNNNEFINREKISCTLQTSGSTGSSLQYYDSIESANIRMASHYRGWKWLGYTPDKRLGIIASAQGNVESQNTLHVSGELTNHRLQLTVKELLSFQPQHFRGYVTSLYILAKFCKDNKVIIPGVESINTISENLYPFQRDLIEQVFQCKVFEEYCCNDGGACGWECEHHSSLHYCMERAIIEEIDGEIITTDLWNLAMPFIRYKNGDSVEFLREKCNCGRNLPLIRVKGRKNDIIITPKGILSPSFLAHHGIGMSSVNSQTPFRSGIQSIQYVQKPGYILEINIVKNPWCTDKEIKNFKNEILALVDGMEIIINYVDAIPVTGKGKRSFIINEDKKLIEKYYVNLGSLK